MPSEFSLYWVFLETHWVCDPLKYLEQKGRAPRWQFGDLSHNCGFWSWALVLLSVWASVSPSMKWGADWMALKVLASSGLSLWTCPFVWQNVHVASMPWAGAEEENTQGLSEAWPWYSTHAWWFSIFVAFQGAINRLLLSALTVSLPLFHYNYSWLNIYSVLDTLHISSSFYSNLAKCACLTFYTRGNGPCEVKLSEYVVQINWLADSNSVHF